MRIFQNECPFLVPFQSIHLPQLLPLHFEVSGPQTQHSKRTEVNARVRPKAKIKAEDDAAVRKAVLPPRSVYVQCPNVGKQVIGVSYL